jgi:hypothetical protein
MAILARLQFLQYEALDLDSAFRELLHHASAVRAPGQQGGLVRGRSRREPIVLLCDPKHGRLGMRDDRQAVGDTPHLF